MQSSSGGGGDNEFGSLLDSVPRFFNPPTLFEPSSSQSIMGAQGLNRVPFPSSSAVQPKPNPKKRTRASRKPPTTVLTTDPTNFKAMVQELTGIPAPPFSSPSSFSPRLDLLRPGSFGIRSSHLGPSRSSATIVQPAATPLLNLQTQMVRPDLSQGSSVSAPTMASLDELSFSHGGSGLNAGNQAHLRPFDGIYGNDDHNNTQRLNGTDFKLDYSVFSSGFHHEKGFDFENLPSRAEGRVDSLRISPAD
ncbi:hypothetical protein HRI_002728900 [Hibiscus trionum]|uniref:VQ domain-containing protein n=1 Tax=Hibiscus trionum TaxID=183268 RepID=A0A9W7I8N4_HIBTR|nr:hypothetical protein HRI_002728900 [Hibiscus trionum]